VPFEQLFQPLKLKSVIFPNRIVFPPVQTNLASGSGEATERLIRFHKRIAENRVGLSIVGATGISPQSRLGTHSLCLFEDRHIAPARRLFREILDAGSIPAVQLNHGGRVLDLELAHGDIVGPSAIPSPATGVVPRELAVGEIEDIIGQFIHSAEAAKTAGAALVEFHAAHSFLLNQFLSPASNKRRDEYGGSTKKRGRIVCNILEGARRRVGKDFVLGLRMSMEEYVEGGLSLQESLELIHLFIESGLDIIHVSGGGIDTGPRMLQEAAQGNLLKLAGKVKEKVAIPVIGVGGILHLRDAEAAIEEGLADMVALGRALIADPALVTKTLEGNVETVTECTGCLLCFMRGEEPGIQCSVNSAI